MEPFSISPVVIVTIRPIREEKTLSPRNPFSVFLPSALRMSYEKCFPHQTATRRSAAKTFPPIVPVTTFYLPLCFILVLYWRIYQAARKRINKRKIESPIIKKNRRHDTPKRFSTAKFRFANRKKVPKEDWDSPQNSEAVNIQNIFNHQHKLDSQFNFPESIDALKHQVGEQRQQQQRQHEQQYRRYGRRKGC